MKQRMVLLFCMIMCVCFGQNVINVSAEEMIQATSSKTISEIIQPYHTISLMEKISLEELEKQFPTELEVILSNGVKESIPIIWICECDYEKDEFDSYVFEALFPEGYVISDTCPCALLLVTLDDYIPPEVHRVYGANPDSGITIDQYLGVTSDVARFLEQYEPDENGNYSTYYLSTPYFENLYDVESNLIPNGEGADGVNSGMNCVGFVGNVLRHNGADLTKVTNRLPGWYANASNWNDFVDTYNIKSYRFTSISEMLQSGVLQKGDIIYFEPDWSRADDDCHMGFFWGDSSDEDKFWNTSTSPSGNWITSIQSKSPIYYIYVFPVSHSEEIILPETGSAQMILLILSSGVITIAALKNKNRFI